MNAPDMLVECGGRRTLEGLGSLLPLCGFLRSNSIMAARTFTRGDLLFFFLFLNFALASHPKFYLTC